jgi:penicillin-binding protein 2
MRVRIYILIIFSAFVLLFAGLFNLQIRQHERYKLLSEENRLKIIPLLAPRGAILDRNGDPLVKDILSFDACIIHSQVKDFDRLTDILSEVLGLAPEEISHAMKKAGARPYSPVCVAADIGMEKAVHIEESAATQPGMILDISSRRKYFHAESASAILGYLGTINRKEFEKLKHYGYSINDMVGRAGVERTYDDYLRGTHGGKQVEVDHLGRELRILGYREPVPGKDVYLTIDGRLQRYCDELLEDKQGAIVAMYSDTGEVLALSSAPDFDPEIFVDRKRNDEASSILKRKDYPLMNRAVSGVYPPGSIFKAVVACAGLDSGVLSTSDAFYCPGSLTLGGRVFHCWRESGHGEQVLKEAIKNSCNVFFWKLGLMLGVDRIAEYGSKFGIGKRTGIDLPAEAAGVRPTRVWKRKSIGEKWYRGETLNYSVGQGYLLCTPLQIARLMAVFANRGYLVKPYVVSRVDDIEINTPHAEKLDLPGDVIDTVRDGLRKVVNDRRGTGVKARLADVVVSGKTGTAQTSRGKDHGWFAGFAPFEGENITVVILDEYGGKGGYYAAGTAGKVLEKAHDLGLMERGPDKRR